MLPDSDGGPGPSLKILFSCKPPQELHPKARRQLDLLNAVTRVEDLRVPPGWESEAVANDLFCGILWPRGQLFSSTPPGTC